MAEYIRQSEFSSTTDRTQRRTNFLRFLDNELRIWIRKYFSENAGDDQITLYIFSKIGRQRFMELCEETGRTENELKQCLGLRTPMIISEMVGNDNIETFRDPISYKNSKRTVSADWKEISEWVKSYTPHRINEIGQKIIGNAE